MVSTSISSVPRRRRWPVAVLAVGAAMLWALAATSPAAADAGIGKRVALVIGNSRYKNIPPLANPGSDAKLIARALQAAGFTLVGGGVQLDLDKPKFDDLVEKFGRAIAGADVALFYYSGHGLQAGGENYLLPVTANPAREQDLQAQLVGVAAVLRQMSGAGTKLNIVILDACRNNPFSGRGLRGASGGLAEMRAPEGTLISYATQPGNVASDGDGADSPFSFALAEALRLPGLDLLRLFNRVGVQVKRTTRGQQQPWVAASPLEGEFFFTPPAGGAPAAAEITTPIAPPEPVGGAEPATEATTLAANDRVSAQPNGNDTGLAALPPFGGFHCPAPGTTTAANGIVTIWQGATPGAAHVCVSKTSDGQVERRVFGFYAVDDDDDAKKIDDALSGFFLGTRETATVMIKKQRYRWRREGTEHVLNHGESVEVSVLRVETMENPTVLSFNHRGSWRILYDAGDGLLLKGSYSNEMGNRDAEPPDWEITTFNRAGT